MKNNLIWLFRFILGSLFILSAISKLLPIEAFDLTIVNQGIAGWNVAPYLSRFIISIEFFLGISFFINPFVKKIAVPFSFLLLVVFCIHLIYLISTGSGSKNCGCFGELIPMSSLEALIKNLVLIILLYLLHKYFVYEKKLNYSFAFAVFSIVFAGMFLFFQVKPYNIPTEEATIQQIDSVQTSTQTNVDTKTDTVEKGEEKPTIENKDETAKPKVVSIFGRFKEFSGETVNLDSGIKLVCLFSLDCEDCMQTAFKLGLAKNDWKNFPNVYILFLGEEEQVNNFFDAAAMTFPYKIIPPQTFFPLIKNYPPRVVLLNNGNIVGDWSYENFSVDELRKGISE